MNNPYSDFTKYKPETLARHYAKATYPVMMAIFHSIDEAGLSSQSLEDNIESSKAISAYLTTLQLLIENGREDLQALDDYIEDVINTRMEQYPPEQVQRIQKIAEFLDSNGADNISDFVKQEIARDGLVIILDNPEKYRVPFQSLPNELTSFFDWIEMLYRTTLKMEVFTSCFFIDFEEAAGKLVVDNDEEKLAYIVVQAGEEILFSTMAVESCFSDGEHFKQDHQEQIGGVIAQLIIRAKNAQ